MFIKPFVGHLHHFLLILIPELSNGDFRVLRLILLRNYEEIQGWSHKIGLRYSLLIVKLYSSSMVNWWFMVDVIELFGNLNTWYECVRLAGVVSYLSWSTTAPHHICHTACHTCHLEGVGCHACHSFFLSSFFLKFFVN